MSWSHVAVFVLFLLAGSGGRAEAADARHGQRSAEARASRAARAAASLETMREEFVRPEEREATMRFAEMGRHLEIGARRRTSSFARGALRRHLSGKFALGDLLPRGSGLSCGPPHDLAGSCGGPHDMPDRFTE